MKRFCIHIIIFLIIWFALSIPVDIYITHKIRTSQTRAIAVWEDIFNGRIDADMLFLGSSRTSDAYNPAIFDSILGVNSYNLGMHGNLIDKDILRYNLYYKYSNRIPKYIIWDLCNGAFGYSQRVFDYQFAPYLFDDDVFRLLHNSRHKFTIFDRYVPLLRYYRQKNIIGYAIKNKHFNTGYYKGFKGKDWHWNPENLNKLEDKSIPMGYNPELLPDFLNTVKKMKESGSEVIFIYSPFHYEGQVKQAGMDSLFAIYQQIAEDNNCIFLNYNYDSMCYDTSYFIDATHLNLHGANVFSAKCSKDLDSIFNFCKSKKMHLTTTNKETLQSENEQYN